MSHHIRMQEVVLAASLFYSVLEEGAGNGLTILPPHPQSMCSARRGGGRIWPGCAFSVSAWCSPDAEFKSDTCLTEVEPLG